MRIIEPGHRFLLNCLDGGPGDESLRFVKRLGPIYPGNSFPAHGGTTTQEVLRVVIARAQYVNEQLSDSCNDVVVASARASILALENRAARRHGRVLPLLPVDIENIPTCQRCGHIFCTSH